MLTHLPQAMHRLVTTWFRGTKLAKVIETTPANRDVDLHVHGFLTSRVNVSFKKRADWDVSVEVQKIHTSV